MVASANVKATYVLKYYTGAAWVDITAECMRNPFVATWGMVDNNPLTFMADTGGMTFTLDNRTGHYSPETATVSTGWAKGTPIQLILTYDTIPYVRFRGRVDTLVFHHEINDVKSVDVNCLDWLDFAAKYPLTNPQVANYITGDVAINTIIAAMPIKPVTQALDVGAYSYPSLLDAVSVRTTAYEEFNKLALSEMSYCYLRHDKVNGEMFVFENNIHRPGTAPLSVVPKMIAASGFVLKGSSATDRVLKAGSTDKLILDLVDNASFTDTAMSIESTYGENITNRFVINTYPKTIDTGAVILYNLGKAIKIASGATKKVTGKYRNPIGGKEISGINMIAPVATTDYLMNTKSDGTGTNTTADLVVVCTYDSSKPTYALTNNNAAACWVTYLKARGYGIYQDDTLTVTLENATSQTAYGVNDLTLEQTYQQDTDLGTLIGGEVLEYNKTPHTKINSITFNANLSTFTMQAFLNIDVGSLIQIIDTPYAVNDWFYVQGVSFSAEIGGQINATWIVKKASSIASGGLSPIGVTFADASTDAINYGIVPYIDDIDAFSFSVWITPRARAGGLNLRSILSAYTNISGFIFDYDYANTCAVFINCYFGGDHNYHEFPHTLALDSLWHIVITGRLKATIQTVTYYNAVVKAEGILNTGTAANSNMLVVGNHYNSGIFDSTFSGEIRDARLYNRILTAAEVTAIYNGGTPSATAGTTRGMIFQGPCVRTGELTRYVGATLTADLPVLDNVNGYVGTINGAPTGSAF